LCWQDPKLWTPSGSKPAHKRKRKGKLKREVAVTTAEEGTKFKGVSITLKMGRTMQKQDGAKEFEIISSQGRSFQGASPPFLPSRFQGGRW